MDWFEYYSFSPLAVVMDNWHVFYLSTYKYWSDLMHWKRIHTSSNFISLLSYPTDVTYSQQYCFCHRQYEVVSKLFCKIPKPNIIKKISHQLQTMAYIDFIWKKCESEQVLDWYYISVTRFGL